MLDVLCTQKCVALVELRFLRLVCRNEEGRDATSKVDGKLRMTRCGPRLQLSLAVRVAETVAQRTESLHNGANAT
jgi:hypothetical protein